MPMIQAKAHGSHGSLCDGVTPDMLYWLKTAELWYKVRENYLPKFKPKDLEPVWVNNHTNNYWYPKVATGNNFDTYGTENNSSWEKCVPFSDMPNKGQK